MTPNSNFTLSSEAFENVAIVILLLFKQAFHLQVWACIYRIE